MVTTRYNQQSLVKKKTKSLTRIYNHEKLVENEDDSKPEEDKSIPGNKLFGADEEAPATLKEMPLWLTWHLEFVCHILMRTMHSKFYKLQKFTTMETLAMSLIKNWTA